LEGFHPCFDFLEAVAGGLFKIEMALEIEPELRGIAEVNPV